MTTEPTPETATGARASAEQSHAVKPSKLTITKLLAEAEVARRHSLKPWLLALLLPLLLGAALIVFSSYAVSVRLATINDLDRQTMEKSARIAELDDEIKRKNAELASETSAKQSYETALKEALPEIQSAEKRQEVVAALATNPAITAAPPRVFIQIYDEVQRGKANEVAQSLKGSGFNVPGIEPRPEIVSSNLVKYFRQEDSGTAEQVADILKSRGVAGVKTVLVGGYKAAPGQIEIWFAPAKPTPADAGMIEVQNRVRSIIGLTTTRRTEEIVSGSTLESLGATSASHMTYIRQRIMLEFSLSPELPALTPKTKVGTIERLVYERTSKKTR